MDRPAKLTVQGFDIYKNALSRPQQEDLRDAVRDIIRAAPLIRPVTPSGKAMSVRMSAAGRLGWITDRAGYRYSPTYPGVRGREQAEGQANDRANDRASEQEWPPIPEQILDIWHHMTGIARTPDCCLVNYYDTSARMGMHQDRDEGDFDWPVLSISLGDTATFRMGGVKRGDPTSSVRLESGDIVVMGGAARLAYHGVDRILPGTSTLLRDGGRINLTLRVVDHG